MKKIIAFILAAVTVASLAGCKGLLPAVTTAETTDEITETEITTDTETETETEAVTDDRSEQYFEMCREAYSKTHSSDDIMISALTEWKMNAEYVGLTRKIIESRTETEYKQKGKGEDKTAEMHQKTSSAVSGVKSESTLDLFLNGDEIYYKTDADKDFSAMKKDSEKAAAYAALLDSADTDDIKPELTEFKSAEYSENADGSETVTVVYGTEAYKQKTTELLAEFKETFEQRGATDVNIDNVSITAKYTVKDGYLISAETEISCDIKMKAEGTDVKAQLSSVSLSEYKDAGQPVEIVMPVVPEKFELYSPFLFDKVDDCTLILYGNGAFEASFVSSDSSSGFTVSTYVTFAGDYSNVADPDRISIENKRVIIKTKFNSADEKNAYKTLLGNAYNSGSIGEDMYKMILGSMDDEGFDVTVENMKNALISMGIMSESERATEGDIILDREAKKAYRTVKGVDLKENQYYIASDEMVLTLNGDGTCSMRGEFKDTEPGLGEYVTSYDYNGKYEKTDMVVRCIFNKNSVKLTFKSDDALKLYKQSYTEAYENGYLGKAVYEYYMDLVTKDGFTDEKEQVFKFTLESHTKTAVVVEYPDETN